MSAQAGVALSCPSSPISPRSPCHSDPPPQPLCFQRRLTCGMSGVMPTSHCPTVLPGTGGDFCGLHLLLEPRPLPAVGRKQDSERSWASAAGSGGGSVLPQ